MSNKQEKITWVTCPECGSKIGIVISVGRTSTIISPRAEETEWPPEEAQPQDITSQLKKAGVDLTLVDIKENGVLVSITPKKFLGDMWGPLNEAIKILGGNWIRDGRNSRWELQQEAED